MQISNAMLNTKPSNTKMAVKRISIHHLCMRFDL